MTNQGQKPGLSQMEIPIGGAVQYNFPNASRMVVLSSHALGSEHPLLLFPNPPGLHFGHVSAPALKLVTLICTLETCFGEQLLTV